MCLPLLASYVVEREAKCAHLVRLGLARPDSRDSRKQRMCWYLLALLACTVLCDCAVDAVHWTGLVPLNKQT